MEPVGAAHDRRAARLAHAIQAGARFARPGAVQSHLARRSCGIRRCRIAKQVRAAGVENAVRIEATSAAVGEPFTLSCRSALALALWDRHVVQPAARTHFDATVKRLEHFGSYACRNIYGRKDAPLSRHATADALDVAGFVLSNGRRIAVRRDWGSEDADGLFLREVHAGACRVFDGVLGPDYNEAHRDHFHLERGGYRACR